MTLNIQFEKGGNKGGIFDNGNGSNITYTAVLASKSKTYKTLKSAVKFLKENGYNPATKEDVTKLKTLGVI